MITIANRVPIFRLCVFVEYLPVKNSPEKTSDYMIFFLSNPLQKGLCRGSFQTKTVIALLK